MGQLPEEDQVQSQPDQQAEQEIQIQNQRGGENVQEEYVRDGLNPQGQDEFGEMDESKMQQPPAQESNQENRIIDQGSEQLQSNNINNQNRQESGRGRGNRGVRGVGRGAAGSGNGRAFRGQGNIRGRQQNIGGYGVSHRQRGSFNTGPYGGGRGNQQHENLGPSLQELLQNQNYISESRQAGSYQGRGYVGETPW